MKNIFKIAILVAAFAIGGVANATKPTPPPENTGGNSQSESNSNSNSSSNSGANSGSSSNSGATGGSVGNVGAAAGATGGTANVGDTDVRNNLDNQNRASVGDVNASPSSSSGASASVNSPSYAATDTNLNNIGNNDSKYISLSLPQPVWTQVPTAFGCIVTESKALAGGWNFVSGSTTKQFSEFICVSIRMAESANLHCQYLSAAHLNQRVFETMYEGQKGDFFHANNPRNLSLAECEALKRPQLRVSDQMSKPAVSPVFIENRVESACPSPTVATRPVTRSTSGAVRKTKPTQVCK